MGASRLSSALLVLVAVLAAAPSAAQDDGVGKEVYDRWCAGCHGVNGDGLGPGAGTMLPRPRDFTRALYQVRTTGSGELPTDDDIMKVIDEGMPGTAMPGWESLLSQAERNALVTYLKSFSRFFQGDAPQPLEFSSAPRASDERIAEGEALYEQVECWQCHGQQGRGDGPSAPTLEDDAGLPIKARDLTRNWNFNGGPTVEDIYRTMRTGLDGTPMPTFSDLIDSGIITDDQLWNVAHYVRSLSPEDAPATREVIGAELLEDAPLPSTAADPVWDDVERYFIPMVGQIVVAPRWFNPRINGIWVQALHDGQEVALRLSWTDPSRSPDPEWAEYATRIFEAMEPKDEGAFWEPGAPDRVVVQFPQQMPRGMERPYFLQGDARRPAYLWQWESDGSGREMVATGMGTAQESGTQELTTDAAWADGQWQVVFRRALATADVDGDLQFPTAQGVPITFQAWDGDNGESGNQGAVSTWYFITLQQRTPVTVYVAPTFAMVLTAGLGLLAVARAQRRERESALKAGDDDPETDAHVAE